MSIRINSARNDRYVGKNNTFYLKNLKDIWMFKAKGLMSYGMSSICKNKKVWQQ